MRTSPAASTVRSAVVVAAAGLSSFALQAQPPANLPTALPTHSGLHYEMPPGETSSGVVPVTGLLPPPSNDAPDFVPSPPLAAPQPSGPTWPIEPPPAPLFSWRPTYVPPDAKSGALQAALQRVTYLPRFDDAGFGMTDLTTYFTLALPPFISGSPILVTPSFTAHYLNGPLNPDLPSTLYDGELEFRYMKQLTGRWGMDLAAAPSYFGDGVNFTSDAFRVTGRALAAWDWTPTIKLVAGVLILGRSDFPVLPAGGVIWKPTPDWRLDVIFPRPKFSYRFAVNGDVEHRAYLGGEFGGNTWAIERSGVRDKVTYSDLRMLLGWERYVPRGLNCRAELGWVFNREISLESGRPGFLPDDTLLVRGELSY